MNFKWIDRFRKIETSAPTRPEAEVAIQVLRIARSLIVDADSPDLPWRLCTALIAAFPELALTWLWTGPRDAKTIQPTAWAGTASNYAAQLKLERGLLTQLGPVYRAAQGERPEAYEITPDSIYRPWQLLAKTYAVRAVMVAPMSRAREGETGIVAMYATESGFFTASNSALFWELGELFGHVLLHSERTTALAAQAMHDPLSGLLNRRGLMRIWTDESLALGSMILIDIDHFKAFNTEHGHAHGDAILSRMAEHLAQGLRANDHAARIGGDEFVVICPELQPRQAAQVAQRLLDHAPASFSAGIVAMRTGEDFSQALERASHLLRRAKDSGRGRLGIEEARII